ncbi:hypothetical protein BDV98DRAFT_598839 [Pterulicium gracile]|uniref:Uncharacterized protein n=1 Tax=Pterulicium gracile TaxID=1884261 RepID=A0A5C3Q063_9AGAR|nr:hypothetical protein BDV98DRAFT_598839 [Pterula gracilis]
MADIVRNGYPAANAFIKSAMTLATEENLKGIYNFSIDKYAAGSFKKLKDAKVNNDSETVLTTTSSKGKMRERKKYTSQPPRAAMWCNVHKLISHNTTNCNAKGGGAHGLTDKEVKAKKAADAHACPKKRVWKSSEGIIYHFVDSDNSKTIASIQPEEAHIAAIFATPANATPA